MLQNMRSGSKATNVARKFKELRLNNHTFISDGLQHADINVVDQVQQRPISEQSIPDNKNVIHWELTTKQQANPATVNKTTFLPLKKVK